MITYHKPYTSRVTAKPSSLALERVRRYYRITRAALSLPAREAFAIAKLSATL